LNMPIGQSFTQSPIHPLFDNSPLGSTPRWDGAVCPDVESKIEFLFLTGGSYGWDGLQGAPHCLARPLPMIVFYIDFEVQEVLFAGPAEHGAEIKESFDWKERLIEIGHAQLPAGGQPDLPPDAALDPLQAFEHSPAGASFRQKTAEVAGSVTDERHGAPVERGEYDLSEPAFLDGFSCLRVDDFKIEVQLSHVVAEMRPAFNTTPKSHFRHAVVIVDLASPKSAEFVPDGIRGVIRAQKHAARRGFSIAEPCKRENMGWDSHKSINAFAFHDLEGLAGIADGAMSNSHCSRAVQCPGEQIAHAAGTFSGQKDEHPLSRAGQGRHANAEEVDSRQLVLFSEIYPLGISGSGRSLQRDYPFDFTLRDAQKPHGILPQLIRSGEWKPSQVARMHKLFFRKARKALFVDGTPGSGPQDRFAQFLDLI